MVVIPVKKKFQLSDQRVALEGNQDQTSALNLHGLDEALQDCDAPVFTYGSETLCDASRPAPVVHLIADELSFLIRDQILRLRSNQQNDPVEQGDNGQRIRPSLKHLKPVYST